MKGDVVLSFFLLLLSDAHKKGIVSCPVSPSSGLRLPSRSMNSSGMISPSPTSSLHTASGSSTPQPRSGKILYHQTKQPIFPQEALGTIQKSPTGFQSNGGTAYQEGPKQGQFQRNMQARRDIISPEYNALANHNRRAVEGVRREFRNEKACLADCASQQQLVRDNTRPNAPIDRKSGAPVAGRMDGL